MIGGGQIALHKIQNLLRFRLNICVVSPVIHPDIEKLEKDGLVAVQLKEAEEADYQDAFLVIAVTNSPEVNDEVARKAKAMGKLVIHTGQQELGNCTIPATLQRGRFTISISTGGASPTLAKQLRDELEEQYDESYGEYIDFLYEVRQTVKKVESDRAVRRRLLKVATDPAFYKDEQKRMDFLHKLQSKAGATDR
ncbi:NAD(P)-dependent oxidoreductase [Bacillus thermotolerans]|uniref:precorrin-2 dehydrogenase n=2 Tax=Bacillus thermotolerans TaxID=1221996 RepID=A0A0F5HPG4_BACTR|nr:NAD(P)-dependent oxidoreductase [Bacillus thermotolerans]KKB34727.1 Siroheme synthase [Bacillus thermotolerans]KKB36336.1 Siroheme synthase / Precorrin-2 oxidase [Bacillus thermotolerans]KKB44870.1 Siroheme synthase [Bacillus thermotolerans]